MAATSTIAGLCEAVFLVLATRLAFAVTKGQSEMGVLAGRALNVHSAVYLAFVLVIARFALALFAGWLATRMTIQITAELRRNLMHSFLHASWARQQADRAGRLQELMTNYANAGSTLVANFTGVVSASFGLISLLALAVGVDPHGPNDTPDFTGLRYGKICILSDADVDGSHIQVLLLTLFFRHFPKLIETGHVYVARPPLFRVDAPARGKKPAAKLYALDEGELTAILDKLRKDGVPEGKWSIGRFKGLGEMNAEQLWETTLNPDTRRLLPVQLGRLDFSQTAAEMTKLMGKGEAAARRELMELHGDAVEIDI